MRIEIISKNYKKGEKLDNIINEKLSKFERYFEDDAVAKVTLKQIGKEDSKTVKYEMEIAVFFGTNVVRSAVISDNMYKNIDLALPKIEGVDPQRIQDRPETAERVAQRQRIGNRLQAAFRGVRDFVRAVHASTAFARMSLPPRTLSPIRTVISKPSVGR